MTRKLIIALASAVVLLASLGGHAFADPTDHPGDPCIPGLDVPTNPI